MKKQRKREKKSEVSKNEGRGKKGYKRRRKSGKNGQQKTREREKGDKEDARPLSTLTQSVRESDTHRRSTTPLVSNPPRFNRVLSRRFIVS